MIGFGFFGGSGRRSPVFGAGFGSPNLGVVFGSVIFGSESLGSVTFGVVFGSVSLGVVFGSGVFGSLVFVSPGFVAFGSVVFGSLVFVSVGLVSPGLGGGFPVGSGFSPPGVVGWASACPARATIAATPAARAS